jgi:shikimate kinase
MSKETRNIVLAGFMGTGKSAVGKLVAVQMGRRFFDMDEAIEHRTGLSILRIFAMESEPYFRAMERGLCYELALQTHLVIATGGGALVDHTNYTVIAKTGFIVCLHATPEVIEARLRASDMRPLAGQWRELLAERQAVYAAMPNPIDTTAKTPEAVAEEVIRLWQSSL